MRVAVGRRPCVTPVGGVIVPVIAFRHSHVRRVHVVLMRRVYVVRVRTVVMRMVRTVGRRRLVLVPARTIAHG